MTGRGEVHAPPGRPPLDREDVSINLHVRLPTKAYDALWKEAQRERVTLADLIRHRLVGARLPNSQD
jgi:hypothetical protein